MSGPVDPFDPDDPRPEQAGEWGVLVRDGMQLLSALVEQPSMQDAASGLGGMDQRDLKALGLAAVLAVKRSSMSTEEYKRWLNETPTP